MYDEQHVIVAGGGRVGRRVAEHFVDRGNSVTVIEPDFDAGRDDATEEGIELIADDATKPSVLREALRDSTTVVGALTDSEDTNLAISMAVKQLSPEVRTVARIESEDGDEYTEFVDEVYFPERASIKAAVNALTGSDVRTLEGVTGDLELFDIRVDFDAPVAGEVVSDVLPEGSVVVSKADGDVAVQHSTKLVAGRRYIVAADHDVAEEVIRKFQGDENQ